MKYTVKFTVKSVWVDAKDAESAKSKAWGLIVGKPETFVNGKVTIKGEYLNPTNRKCQ